MCYTLRGSGVFGDGRVGWWIGLETMPRIYRRMQNRARRIVRLVLSSRHSAHQVAAGAALGMFVGFTPLMGFQMIIAGVLSTLFKFSRIAAVTMVYVTNPLTATPIYVSCYFVGILLLKPVGFQGLSVERIRALFARPEAMGAWDSLGLKFKEVFDLGWAGLAPLWLGCAVCGLVAAAATYYMSLRFVDAQRLLRAQRMARRAQRRLERVRLAQEQQQTLERGKDAT